MASLLAFALVTLLAAAWSASFSDPAWFASFYQLPWTPPAGLIAAGWSLAWSSLALAAWLGWRTAHRHALGMVLGWGGQLALWAGWNWLLFALHRPGWALACLALSLVVQAWTFNAGRSLGAAVTLAQLPTLAWLLLALAWNFASWRAVGGGVGTVFG